MITVTAKVNIIGNKKTMFTILVCFLFGILNIPKINKITPKISIYPLNSPVDFIKSKINA